MDLLHQREREVDQMGFVKIQTACGAPLFIERDEDVNAIAVGVCVKVGSADDPVASGFFHALEHMVFESTEQFRNIKELAGRIEDIGGEIGAGTDNTSTFYWVLVPKRYFRRAVQVLHQMVCRPVFNAPVIGNELLGIVQEIRELEDEPQSSIEDLFRQTIFSGHRLGGFITGNEAAVQALTPRDFRKFHSRFYQPQNIAFVIAGSIERRTARSVIEKHFTSESFPKTGSSEVASLENPPEPVNRTRFIRRAGIRNAYAIIGGSFTDAHKRNGIISEIFSIMLDGVSKIGANSGKGFSWPLSLALRGQGLVYSAGAEATFWRNIGEFAISFNPAPQRLEEACGVVRHLIEKVKNDRGLLHRAKIAAVRFNTLGSESLRDDAENAADEIATYGEPISIEKRNAAIRSVRIHEIRRFVDKFLSPERLVTVAIIPE